MEASVGGGQLLALVASTRISWSGRCVLTDRWSPGSRILLVFMDISLGCVASGGVAVFVLIVLVCCVVVYLAHLYTGGSRCPLGPAGCGGVEAWRCASMQCRCCVSGKSASLCVLGTVHLLPSREIWLWTKF